MTRFDLSYHGKALLKALGEGLKDAGCGVEKEFIADSIRSLVECLEDGYAAVGHRASHDSTCTDMSEIQDILNGIMAENNNPAPADGNTDGNDEARHNKPTPEQLDKAVQMASQGDEMTGEDILNKAG